MIDLDIRAGALFGAAFGDALGRPTEFIYSARMIEQRFGRWGPTIGNDCWQVTDDTMMTIAVADAVIKTNGGIDMVHNLTQAFIEWSKLPQDGRAPGRTCMAACRKLRNGEDWMASGDPLGKGCGANMRVTPIAVANLVESWEVSEWARTQAVLTHAHPTALAAADLTTWAIRYLALGGAFGSIVSMLRDTIADYRKVDRVPGVRSDYLPMRLGWDECDDALAAVELAVEVDDRRGDPCRITGAGWIAEEALATALHCALLYPEDPVKAIRRAAVTSGDSDSIASITGALMGAAYGQSAWPAKWHEVIEFGPTLAAAASLL